MSLGPRIRALEDGRYLLEFEELDSTQAEARRRRVAGEERLAGVRADFQRNGRGRRGTSWFAPRGQSLLVTYLVPVKPPFHRAGSLLSLATAAAVARMIEGLTRLETRLRWPNDVLLGDEKVAGVVVDLFRVPDARPSGMVAALGIGVNVNIAQFPERLQGLATSLRIRTSREWSIEHAEAALRTALFPLMAMARLGGTAGILREWQARDGTVGREYQFPADNGTLTGTAVAITERGTLVVRLPDGHEEEVSNARHASPAQPRAGAPTRRQSGPL